MSRPTVMSGFHPYAQQSPFGSVHGVPAGPMYRLPMRAPEYSAAYNPGIPHHTGHHHGRPSTVSMAGSAFIPADELAFQQEYQYEQPQGPLVGERQSSSAITTEYATADHVYRVKTAALPHKYAYFRKCLPDGHCGWRAVAFSYYEALLRQGDVNSIQNEKVRLMSMANLLNNAGHPPHVVSEFSEPAFDLIAQLDRSLSQMDGQANDILLQTFNDYSMSMSIIFYFKLLANAWIQAHPNDYIPFMPGYSDIKSYCDENIIAANCELDDVGLNALTEVIVKPAGFGFEVLYLDRSPGEEINNTIRLEPTGQGGYAPTMRILYRPGHYDILYKAEDFPSPVVSQPPLHVAMAGYADEYVPMSSFAAARSDLMTMIPGMCPVGLAQHWGPSVSYDCNPNPAPQPQVTPVPSYASAPTPAAMASLHQEYASPVHAHHVSRHSPPNHHSVQLEPPMSFPTHPPPPMSMDRGLALPMERGPFRPSELTFSGHLHTAPLVTPVFRNSPHNNCHFLNPCFQPEMWQGPDDKDKTTGNRGRHKST